MTHAVLLTAAIKPDPRFRVALTDVDRRLRQYVQAIQAWVSFAEAAGAVVLVVETSQSAAILRSVESVQSDRLDVVDWSPSDALLGRGKGAVEAGAIDHVVELLGDRGVTTVTKVTGRLQITNARAALPELRANTVMVRRTLDRRFADTRLIHAASDVWRNAFRDMASDVDEANGVILEHVVALRLIRAEYEQGTSVMRFPRRPRYRGESGTSGGKYGGVSGGIRAGVMERLEGLVERMSSKQI